MNYSQILIYILTVILSIRISYAKDRYLGNRTAVMWEYEEWSVDNPSWSGNPFDVRVPVTFTHQESDEQRTTEMFYDGNNTWKFRFTGTRTGEWTFTSQSEDADLDKLSGEVEIRPNPEKNAHGFMTHFSNKWGWQGTEKAFIPQYVMGKALDYFYDFEKNEVDTKKIEADIREFIDEHGFTGFHLQVRSRWFNLEGEPDGELNPDPLFLMLSLKY